VANSNNVLASLYSQVSAMQAGLAGESAAVHPLTAGPRTDRER
jgi:hypothetical protein